MGNSFGTAAPPVSAEDHENQVRNLRDRNDRRRRELIDTWQARYDTLDNELEVLKKVAGGCSVVAGITIMYLVRRGRGGGGGGSVSINDVAKIKEAAGLVKRTAERDVAAAKTKGIKALSSDLLNVVDDLGQAIATSSGGSNDGSIHADGNIKDGISLVHKNLIKVLDNHGVRKIDAFVNTKFDPMYHEAVQVTTIDDAQEQQKDTIAVVAQEGYTLNDMVLRASRVCVYKENTDKV